MEWMPAVGSVEITDGPLLVHVTTVSLVILCSHLAIIGSA